MVDVGLGLSLVAPSQMDVMLRFNILELMRGNACSRPFRLVYMMSQACYRARRSTDYGQRTGEGWPSGLRRTPGKRVGVNAPPGFESPSLRHIFAAKNLLKTRQRPTTALLA